MSQENAPNFRCIKTSRVCSFCKHHRFLCERNAEYCFKYDFDIPFHAPFYLDLLTCDGFNKIIEDDDYE